MEYLQLTMDEYAAHTDGVKTEMANGVKAFVRMGWHLYMIYATNAYKHDGYRNMGEYTRAKFKMDWSRASRYINVYKKYCTPGEEPQLKERYQDFNFSQLEEMLTLPEEDEAMIRPELDKEGIREVKRFNKENENNPDALLNWHQEPKDCIKGALEVFFEENKNLLDDLCRSEAYRVNDIEEMKKIIRSGRRITFKSRDGKIFIILYDTQIFVKGTAREAQDITWEKFFGIAGEIFAREEIAPAQSDPEEEIPGQDSIMNHPEYMPKEKNIPIEEQYNAIYDILPSYTQQPLNNGEANFLAAMLHKNFKDSAVSSKELNYRAIDEGMLFNPDGEKILVRWATLAEDLIKAFGKSRTVKMASVVEETAEDKWTEAEAVKRYAEEYPKELKEIMKICRQYQNNGDRAKAVQKHFAPYGYSRGGSWEFSCTFEGFSKGVTIESDAERQKVKMKYGRFIVELLNLYDPYAPEFTSISEIAPAQKEPKDDIPEEKTAYIRNVLKKCIHRPEYTCTLTEAQQMAAGDGENCGEKCCWECPNHGTCGFECNSSAHRSEKDDCQAPEETHSNKPEGWPEYLSDIPVPSIMAVDDFLYDAEKELKEYLEVDGLPEKVILHKQLWTAGLRTIKRMLEDIRESE